MRTLKQHDQHLTALCTCKILLCLWFFWNTNSVIHSKSTCHFAIIFFIVVDATECKEQVYRQEFANGTTVESSRPAYVCPRPQLDPVTYTTCCDDTPVTYCCPEVKKAGFLVTDKKYVVLCLLLYNRNLCVFPLVFTCLEDPAFHKKLLLFNIWECSYIYLIYCRTLWLTFLKHLRNVLMLLNIWYWAIIN